MATTNAATTFLLYTRFSCRFRQGIRLLWAKVFNRSDIPDILVSLEPIYSRRTSQPHRPSNAGEQLMHTTQMRDNFDAEVRRKRHSYACESSYKPGLIVYRDRSQSTSTMFSKKVKRESLV